MPHSAIQGSMRVCRSPWLIAAYRGLPRLRVPRHPPHAFARLTTTNNPVKQSTRDLTGIRRTWSDVEHRQNECTTCARSKLRARNCVTSVDPIGTYPHDRHGKPRRPRTHAPNPTITTTFRCQIAESPTATGWRPRAKRKSSLRSGAETCDYERAFRAVVLLYSPLR